MIVCKKEKIFYERRKANFKNYRNKKSYVENIDYDDVMNSNNLVIKLLEQGLVGV